MDCHQTLTFLTTFNNDSKNITDEDLQEIINKVYSYLPQDVLDKVNQDRSSVNDVNDLGWKYLHVVLYTLKTLCNTELAKENPLLTVDQFRNIKTAVEVAACIGIIPSLLPQIKIHASVTRSKTFKLNLDDRTFEKYKRLTYTINSLFECFDKVFFRPALLSQLDCLLAALLQLSHAPLKKPDDQNSSSSSNTSNPDFEMTDELYVQLTNEQEMFRKKLYYLIENCPQFILIKELMVIMAIKNNPKWLQLNIKHYLTERIMMSNGVAALVVAVCDEVSDFGKCWHKLEVTAGLVATSHGLDEEKYYNSVCPQIVEMLMSKNNKQGLVIAKCCIKALHDYKPDICRQKIIHVVMEPFLVMPRAQNDSHLIKNEDEVSRCIANLCHLFITTDAEFKCLPLKLLTLITLPLFYLYTKTYKSVYVLRNQVRELLLKILSDEELRESIFSAFLNHNLYNHKEFGEKLCFRFGVNGGVEIASEPISIEYDELADCLYYLVNKDGPLSFNLFTYLLKASPALNDRQNAQKGKLLECTADIEERIQKQITAVQLLTLLSSSNLVQEACIKNSEPLLEFIKAFFSKIISNYENDKLTYEQDSDILYISLMLIKIILTDRDVKESWKIFQDFTASIRKQFDLTKIPERVLLIFAEIETIIKKKGRLYSNYCDLSADNTKISEFEKALADLSDPLLPVRAHGIIALTKLIESRHPDVMIKKDFILCIFQENLNNDDSFIYLTAINGLCAMSSIFPEKIIEIIVQEFIGMTEQTGNRDMAPETRAKLGEILVKTTRALGEMTPKYKSLLVNGFLCGTRDSDPLVRESSLSCLGEFCKMMGFRLGNLIIEILYCIGCIVKTDKDEGCRRAAVLVATLLLRGLGKDALIQLGESLVPLYRSLKHLRDNDKDPVLQLHAQLALEEFDDIVQQFLFATPKLEKSIFLLA